jgi:hypothetical protein
MVGSLVPPPTNPLSLTQLSSFLSHVNVRMKSTVSTIYEMLDTDDPEDEVTMLFVDAND